MLTPKVVELPVHIVLKPLTLIKANEGGLHAAFGENATPLMVFPAVVVYKIILLTTLILIG
jgi:hypothetical protein